MCICNIRSTFDGKLCKEAYKLNSWSTVL
uniref:Uncharacterized protein n=1 Tax=Arundo donax TaxID=35708 RepID=A0A0A9HZ39_ARUDO